MATWYLVVTQIRGHPAAAQEEFEERHALKSSTEAEAKKEARRTWEGMRGNIRVSSTGQHYPKKPVVRKDIPMNFPPL